MRQSILEKFGLEKVFIAVIIAAVVLVAVALFWLFFGSSGKSISIQSPLGAEEWEIGQTYEIKWEASGIERVGIVLYNADKPEWIAEGVPASQGVFEWKIRSGHDYGSNFWIAVVEYPWRQGNELSYTNGSFVITYPEFENCDSLSIQEEWPYLALDTPDVRRVFITKQKFSGDLEGLEGANEKCQVAAAEMGLSGEWTAFIGGDSPDQTAVKRLEVTPRGLAGVFVEAEEALGLLRGTTCHRMLGRNFKEFFDKLYELELLNKEKLSGAFLNDMKEVWYGRMDQDTQRSCTDIESAGRYSYFPTHLKYSHTVTCQNWSFGGSTVPDYTTGTVLDDRFSICYTPQGEPTYSVSVAGLASGIRGSGSSTRYEVDLGKVCSEQQHIMCIED